MRRVTKALVAGAGAALLFTGCGSADAGEPAGASGNAGQASAEARSAAASQQPAEPTLGGPIALHVSGGFAGVMYGIEVAPDGEVEIYDRGDGQPAPPLSDAQLERLATEVAEVDFASLPPISIDRNAADMFQYRLEYEGHSLLTDRTKDLGEVEQVIDLLAGHLDRGRS